MPPPEIKNLDESVQKSYAKEIQQAEYLRVRLEKTLDAKKTLESDLEERIKGKRKVKGVREKLERKGKLIESLKERIEEVEAYIAFMYEQLSEPVLQSDFEFGESEEMSKLKVFQLIFTPRRFFIRSTLDGRWLDPDEMLLNFCIVDPKRITKTFLGHFDLDGFEEEVMSHMDIMRKKKEIVVSIFENVHPMQRFVHRRDKKGELKRNYRLLVLSDFNDSDDGKILAPHYKGEKRMEEDRKVVQVHDSIYSAYRKISHIVEQDERETFGLNDTITEVEDSHSLLGTIVAKDADEFKARLKKQAKVPLGRAYVSLEKVRTYDKKIAAAILEAIKEIKDSIGRDNPSATRSRLITVIKYLKERLRNISSRSGASDQDKTYLLERIASSQQIMENFFRNTQFMCHQVRRAERTVVFNKSKNAGHQKENVKNLVFQNFRRDNGLARALDQLEKLKVRPFNVYARKLKEKLLGVETGIVERDFEKTREEAIKAFVICKLFKVQRVIESALRELSYNGGRGSKKKSKKEVDIVGLESYISTPMDDKMKVLGIPALLEMAKQINSVLTEREVFPKTTVKSYDKVYKGLYRKVSRMVKRLEERQAQNLSFEEQIKVYSGVKKYLEGFDFPGILAELD